MSIRPTDEEKRAAMRNTKRIAALWDKCVPGTRKASEAHREGGANPYYHQTSQGIFLEFYYGTPRYLWTPWGTWTFAAAITDPPQSQLDAFMARLTCREFMAVRQGREGEYGPVYAILRVDGEALPEPALRTPNQCLDYHAAKAEWEAFFRSV